MFNNASINCGWTLPQHITMLTGTHPLKHKLIYLQKRCALSRRIYTLAECFQKKG
ncbi:unnamed protein product, partial [marine sediment metagenome]